MNKVFFIIVSILVFCCEAKTQVNLVPNGSFEEYYNCPSLTGGYFIDQAKNWYMPTNGSPDYFNVCGGIGLGVPQNYLGYQYPRTGNAYGGYYAGLNNNDNNYYEYLSVKLIQPLEKDKKYILTYYLSRADSAGNKQIDVNGGELQYVNYTAALFSSTLYTAANDYIIPYKPQFVSDPSVFLRNTFDWQKVHGLYKAEGGEEYITIGYFTKYNELKTTAYGVDVYKSILAYYYIDDVSLMEYEYELPDVPNVFTPNGDGANDELYFDMIGIKSFSMAIYNRWGNQVDIINMSSPRWKPKEELNDGVYYYTLNIISEMDTEHYKSGFIQLIRA